VKKKSLTRQSGQLIIEAVLIMTLFFGIAVLIKKQFADKNIVGAMVAKPWGKIAGMMSNGVWKTEAQGRDMHPQGNIFSREGDSQ
jgi:hypothetical protein